MSSTRTAILRQLLERGVGTEIIVEDTSSAPRAGLRAHFSGLSANQGPVFTLTPEGLRRHHVEMRFGRFSADCINQMRSASTEHVLVAHALVGGVAASNEVRIHPEQALESWQITGPDFAIDVMIRDVDAPSADESIARTAERIMVPLMAAMAELIGYDEIETPPGEVEGTLTESVVRRRERSPRNRLLCLTLHGHRCAVCGLAPSDLYGDAGDIIEVHHLEPVSLLAEPRPYDPRTDLVPLCPGCHRALHTRRPYPYTVEELKEIMARARG